MRPSGNLLVIILIAAVTSLFIPFYPAIRIYWNITASLTVGTALLDMYLLFRSRNISYRRRIPRTLPVGIASRVHYSFSNHGTSRTTFLYHDHYPVKLNITVFPIRITLDAGKRLESSYSFIPAQRGDFEFRGSDLLVLSRLKLWWKKVHIDGFDSVKIYPNFHEIKKYTLLGKENKLSQLGVKKRQKSGESSDFHQLREYRSGDTFRQIDWNATSKYLKLISKDYQDERDQQILFMLDCGRRMRHRDGSSSQMDHVLNAMLLVSYIAAQQENAVGFLTFGGINKWFPPKKGRHIVREILNQIYSITPTNEPADYLAAAEQITALQKRRSIILILTNTRDEDSSDLIRAVRLLRRKHLVILADIREEILDDTLKQEIQTTGSAVRFASVLAYMESRKRNHEILNHNGVITFDLLAKQLPPALAHFNRLLAKNLR